MSFQVIIKPSAINSIVSMGIYLSQKGYPIAAAKFTDELIEFAKKIGEFPNKYPACRYKSLAGQGLHCVTYESWVFIYRIVNSRVMILNVIHGSRLK